MKLKEKILKKEQQKGVQYLIRSKTIPIYVGQPEAMNAKDYHRKYLNFLGFDIWKIDNGFFHCKFPEGWRKVYFDPYWIYLLDNYKRRRGAIHFRVLGYDNVGKKRYPMYQAFINYMPRFRAMISHALEFKEGSVTTIESLKSSMYCYLLDSEQRVYKFAEVRMLTKEDNEELLRQEDKEVRSKLFNDANLFLNEMLPEHDNIWKYWYPNEEDKVLIQNFKNFLKAKGLPDDAVIL